MDGKQIYDNFKQGDTRGLRDLSSDVNALSSTYRERGETIKALQARMVESWSGDAADAANAGAGPMERAFYDNAAPMDGTTQSVDTQAEVFDHSGGAVVEIPPKPDKPSPWSIGLKSAIPIAGPFMAKNDMDNYEEGMAKYNQANETNVRVMDQYNTVTEGNMSGLPTDYGLLQSDGSTISVEYEGGGPPPIKPPPVIHELKPNPHESVDDHTSTTSVDTNQTHETGRPTDVTGRPTDVTGRPTDVTGRPTDVTGRPTDVTGRPTDITQPTDTTRPTSTTRPTNRPLPSTDRPGKTPIGTDGIDFYPTGTGGGGGQNYSTTFGSDPNSSTGGRGPTSGNAGSRLLDSNGRPIGGSGTGGSGGSGAAGERGLGSGGRSGMGGLGNAAAAEAAAARSASGRSGQMGPMGAGGRRGEGEDDDEHQRPDYLIEADPDAIFGTDQRTSPPVIGE
ncbi:hypothetical protein M8542_04930 [Amycolatopsis sp. OK19-0408]|uniref:PPE family protein n=1 Tax=Amycolatopsis iheyensis TaxID=2945988 RepID=A0A9X2NCT2_9PSEU|nr:hypothetical protein [Amycolatopsis iheyensis]MCR6482145.1 hypothetical protein [Amycolatopsis iheyensis]